MSEPVSPGRPRRWQLALLLNVAFPPAGYAYVGAWKAVGVFAIALVLAMVGLTEWTVAFPPGVYRLGTPGVVVLALCLAAALGIHAAWIGEASPPKTGSRLRHAIAYIATSVAALTLTQLFYVFWPHTFYSTPSESMSPTLLPGDILAVRGARAACDGGERRPGDVILFRREGQPLMYLHRIVAGPGQMVAMTAGQLTVDGRPVVRNGVGEEPVEFAARPATLVEETLANGRRYRTLDFGPDGALDNVAPTRTPANGWYVLGDNRDNSADSRVRGPVDGRNICGIAFRIITSRDKRHVGQEP